MDIGLFMVPYRLPETNLQDGFDWDMQVIRWAEEFGLSEVWVGEHTTQRWEPVPSPELYLAAAIMQTNRIKLATGANIPANHNPIALAHRLMQFDHMSRGRLMVGLGAGATREDLQIHGTAEPKPMMTEAVEIIRKVWSGEGPQRHEGKYWTLDIPAYSDELSGPYMRPYQQPHPPLAMAGLSPNSSTLREAGAAGCLPMSFAINRNYLAGHWQKYVEGAESAGHTPNRNDWRVAHTVFVADTDDEAMALAIEGGLGRSYREWTWPSYARSGMLPLMAPELDEHDPATMSLEYFAENHWLIGSPDTVVEKLQRDIDVSGGFGTLIAFTFDYLDQPEAYRRNLELLGTEVLPRIRRLKNDSDTSSGPARQPANAR